MPPGFHPLDVEKEWGELHAALLQRERLLRQECDRWGALRGGGGRCRGGIAWGGGTAGGGIAWRGGAARGALHGGGGHCWRDAAWGHCM